MTRMLAPIPADRRKEREGVLCHRAMSVLLETVAISGHLDIRHAQPRGISTPTGTEYVVDTMGCSLLALSAAKMVDWYKCTSNDVAEIKELLGIEAAVHALFVELSTTISFDGTYVDPRHVMLIVKCAAPAPLLPTRSPILRCPTPSSCSQHSQTALSMSAAP